MSIKSQRPLQRPAPPCSMRWKRVSCRKEARLVPKVQLVWQLQQRKGTSSMVCFNKVCHSISKERQCLSQAAERMVQLRARLGSQALPCLKGKGVSLAKMEAAGKWQGLGSSNLQALVDNSSRLSCM
mmetsp:Transcript_15908/g.43286  ORF Transcript_15908/g.43286 Transcript_15908/m.43286 type:complete len:127 (-) Transcript_15908:627-1007(-)